MTDIDFDEARDNFAELVDRAAAGERFTITRAGRPAVVLLGYADWQELTTALTQLRQPRRDNP